MPRSASFCLNVVATDTPKGKAAEKFKELAEKYTGGKVKVEVYPNSTLYKDKEELEALQLGSVKMLAPSNSKFGPLGIREFEVFDLPYILPDLKTLRKVTEGPLGARLLKLLDSKGITGLAFSPEGKLHFVDRAGSKIQRIDPVRDPAATSRADGPPLARTPECPALSNDAPDVVDDAEFLQQRNVQRQQGFADMEARMALFLRDHDVPAAFGQQSGDRRTARAAPEHEHVAIGSAYRNRGCHRVICAVANMAGFYYAPPLARAVCL